MNLAGTIVSSGEWIALAGDSTVSTPAWPLIAPAVAAVAAVFGMVLFAVAAFREGRGLPAVGAGLGFVSLGAGFFVAIAPAFIRPGQITLDNQTNMHALYGDAIALIALVLGGLVTVLGVSAAIWLGARRRDAVGIAGSASLVGAFSLLSVALTLGYAGWLLWNRAIPVLSMEVGPRVHVGQSLDVPVIAEGAGLNWVTVPMAVHPSEPGPLELGMVATESGPGNLVVRVSRTLSVEAGSPLGSPALPLVVGNTWAFEAVTSWQSHYMWFISQNGHSTEPGPTLTVVSSEVKQGLTRFSVERKEPDGAVQKWSVYPWNGKTVVYPDDPAAGEPLPDDEFIHFTSEVAAKDDSGAWLRSCEMLPFSQGACSCFTEPPGGNVHLAGPASCSEIHGNTGSEIASIFLAIVTVGLVLEDPDREVTYAVTHATGPAP